MRTRRAYPCGEKSPYQENDNSSNSADDRRPIGLVHRFAHFLSGILSKTSVAHPVVTQVEVDDQDCCAFEPCNPISSKLRGKAELQDALIERLRDNECKIEKSSRQLSRLLLDKIVKNSSRTALQTG